MITHAERAAHRRRQLFGQVPTDGDKEVSIFESGTIALLIAEHRATDAGRSCGASRMTPSCEAIPLGGTRMIFGGFRAIVDQ